MLVFVNLLAVRNPVRSQTRLVWHDLMMVVYSFGTIASSVSRLPLFHHVSYLRSHAYIYIHFEVYIYIYILVSINFLFRACFNEKKKTISQNIIYVLGPVIGPNSDTWSAAETVVR